jgi:predicted extracellular nuclease
VTTSRTAPVLGAAVCALVVGGLAPAAPAAAAPTDARITEIHYDNAGDDVGEAVEITAPAAADLTGLSVVLYNGGSTSAQAAAAVTYGSPAAVPASSSGVAVVSYPANGLQNGSPDGIALLAADGTVLQFLSYEGVLTASNGPAAGLTSTDIGVVEPSSTPIGQSLQLVGGTWTGPSTSTFGGGTTPDPEPDPEAPACEATTVPVGSVQGSGATSPVAGTPVTVRGTVVADLQDGGFQGFHVQDAGDGDPATSDAVFVYAPGGAPVALGDVVTVTGTATEFPAADPLSVTQLADAAYAVCGTAELPAPATLPMPSTDAEREALEGMLVAPADDLTVSELFDLTSFGEVLLSSGGRLLSPTQAAEPGAAAAAVAAENTTRSITLDDGSSARLAQGTVPPYLAPGDPVRIGDTAQLGPVVLSAGFGSWRLQPAAGAPDTTFAPTNPRTPAPAPVGGDLRVADYNVLNYFVTFGGESRGATSPAELAQQQAKIVAGLQALDADVITLHEIENSAVTTPATPYAAVETLIAALEAADGRDWDYARAHEDGDVITNAVIHRTDVVTPVGDPVAYTSPTFDNARSPIAQTFATVEGGEVFTVVANHLKSKGSACATGNDTSVGGPGNCNADRTAQATELVAFAQQLAASTGDPDVLLTGDFNSYRYEDPLDVVRDAGYTELGESFAPDEYSYVFDGGSGSLDHAFATASLASQVTGLTVWETNAVESFAYEYDSGVDPLYAADPYRASDHNPTVIGLSLDTPATAAVSEPRPFRGDRVTVSGTGFAPGERVSVTIGGRQVGTATADDTGAVSLRPRVPVLLGAGDQAVVLTGTSGDTATTSITLRTLWQELLDRLRQLIG